MNLDNAKDNGRRSGGEHLRKGSGVWRVIKKPKADCGVSGGDEKDRDGREKGCCNQLAEKGKVEYIFIIGGQSPMQSRHNDGKIHPSNEANDHQGACTMDMSEPIQDQTKRHGHIHHIHRVDDLPVGAGQRDVGHKDERQAQKQGQRTQNLAPLAIYTPRDLVDLLSSQNSILLASSKINLELNEMRQRCEHLLDLLWFLVEQVGNILNGSPAINKAKNALIGMG